MHVNYPMFLFCREREATATERPTKEIFTEISVPEAGHLLELWRSRSYPEEPQERWHWEYVTCCAANPDHQDQGNGQ